MPPSEFDQSLSAARVFESRSQWHEALAAYESLDTQYPGSADIKLALAIAYLKLGDYPNSIESGRACLALDTLSWQAMHTIALAMRKTGRLLDGLKLLAKINRVHPEVDAVRIDYSEFVCRVLGDFHLAESILSGLPEGELKRLQLERFAIKKSLYNGTQSRAMLKAHQIAYGNRELGFGNLSLLGKPESEKPVSGKSRERLGLLSTMFRASPVYYLCFETLQCLAREVDLVFFSRETVSDWGTAQFKGISAQWHDVGHLDALALAKLLGDSALDAVIDLSGLLDKSGLKALSAKPVPRQFKWVGGQSMTTGLSCFDGYLSDDFQSPGGVDVLYTEPLVRLQAGYVTYGPPAYLPEPRGPSTNRDAYDVGVIGHPLKVSEPFLRYLRAQMETFDGNHQISLLFIGWRYGLPAVQRRILAVIGQEFDLYSDWLTIRFVPTKGHENFLKQVAELDWVLDTFPYTAGVTALESLAMGVPIRTRAGPMFSERHSYSHCRHAGLAESDFDLEELGAFGAPKTTLKGGTLLPKGCPRRKPQALAAELLEVLFE